MEELEEIQEMDEGNDEFLEVWDRQLERMHYALLLKLYDMIDLIDILAPLGNNLMVLVRIRSEIPRALFEAGYEDMVNSLVKRVQGTNDTLNRYLLRVFPDSGFESRRMLDEVASALDNVRMTMQGSVVEQTYVRPIVDQLQKHILARSTRAELRRSLKEILSKGGLSTRYVSTYASDALYQFSRSYTLMVADSQKAQYFYYMGTKISTTRGFCEQRCGRAYTRKEVEAWGANLKWAGRIPGTTAQSIFWYVGGYRCRHRLLPISRVMYLHFNNQNPGLAA